MTVTFLTAFCILDNQHGSDLLIKITIYITFSKFMLLYFSVHDAVSTRIVGYVLKRAGF